MLLTTLVFGVVFLCNNVHGSDNVPDVTTIYEIEEGLKNRNEKTYDDDIYGYGMSSRYNRCKYNQWRQRYLSETSCVEGVKGRVHGRTNALGLGFVDQHQHYLGSDNTETPNITCDSNFGNKASCSSWNFKTGSPLPVDEPMINGKAYELKNTSLRFDGPSQESFLYFTKTSEFSYEKTGILLRIQRTGGAYVYDDCGIHYGNFGPFTIADRDGDMVKVSCRNHHREISLSPPNTLTFDVDNDKFVINGIKNGTAETIMDLAFEEFDDVNYFSVSRDESDEKSFILSSLGSPEIIIDEEGLTSPVFTPTSKNLCLSVVCRSATESPPFPELKISTVGLLNESSTVLYEYSLKNGTNIKLVNVSLENLNPIKLNITKTGLGNVTFIRLSTCNPEGEEVAEIPGSTNCRSHGYSRYSREPAYQVYTTTVDAVEPLIQNSTGCCRNGGVFTSAGCACPPGFSGPTCEIGCGRNRFGQDCEGLCSFHTEECKGLLLCTKYTGCHCAPGYHRLGCTEACDAGWYGNDCSQRCGHCAEGSPCDIYTGQCVACEIGYVGPLCQKESVYYRSWPKLSSPSYGTIVVTFDPNNYVTHGEPPQMYQIQIREKNSEWKVYVSKYIQPPSNESGKGTEVSEKIEGLKNGVLYEVRILLIDAYFFKYDGDLVRVAEIKTDCDIPETYDYKLKSEANNTSIQVSWNYETEDTSMCAPEMYEVTWREGWKKFSETTTDKTFTLSKLIPGLPIKFKVRAQTSGGFAPYSETLVVSTVPTVLSPVRNLRVEASQNTSIQLSWDPPRDAGDTQLQYTVSYKCVNRPACLPGCQNVSKAQLTQQTTSVTLSPLLPFTLYLVTVSANGGPPSSVYAGTSKVVPTEVPVLIDEKTVRTNTSLTVYWDQGPVCTGFLQGYNYQITKVPDTSTILESGFTKETHVSFHNLSASTDYEIRVYVVTVAGWNPAAYLAININTSATDLELSELLNSSISS